MSLFTGTNLIDLEDCESTNNYARQLLREKQPFEGTVVRTFRQRFGRGQRGKYWESADFCNLTFSLIYYPVFLSAERQFSLSKAVSLGVADFVKTIIENEKVSIKWPNDIYVNYRKIAGILIENTVSGNQISSSVIGIGLNVNQTQFSPEIPNPVSLKMLKEIDFELETSFRQLCDALEMRYLQLKWGNKKIIDEDYHSSLFGLNERGEFIVEGKNISAEIIGVNEEGKLKLRLDDKIEEYDMNHIVCKI